MRILKKKSRRVTIAPIPRNGYSPRVAAAFPNKYVPCVCSLFSSFFTFFSHLFHLPQLIFFWIFAHCFLCFEIICVSFIVNLGAFRHKVRGVIISVSLSQFSYLPYFTIFTVLSNRTIYFTV